MRSSARAAPCTASAAKASCLVLPTTLAAFASLTPSQNPTGSPAGSNTITGVFQHHLDETDCNAGGHLQEHGREDVLHMLVTGLSGSRMRMSFGRTQP
eukprot:293940-Chlamydomonas_euryale.AAC.2